MTAPLMKVPLRGRIKIYAGSAPSVLKPKPSGRLPYIKVDDLNIDSKYQSESREYVDDAPIVVPKGAVLFPKRGAAISNNKVRIAARDVCLDTNVMGVETLDGLDPEYFYYAITHEKLYKVADTSTIPQLNNKHLNGCKLWIPHLRIQRLIAGTLGKLDAYAGELSALIHAKRTFKRGLMQQLLAGQKRFPEFRDRPWIAQPIGTLFEEVERPVDWDDDADYRLVSIRRRSGGMFLREVKKGKDIKTKSLFTVRTGDIVISRMQVVHGAVSIVPPQFDGCQVSGMYLILVPRAGAAIDPQFFDYLSRMPRMYHAAYVSSYGVHIEKMTFNPEWYFETKIRVPAQLEEQSRIASVLRVVDSELDFISAQRDQIEMLKHSLLSRLLSGDLPVPS